MNASCTALGACSEPQAPCDFCDPRRRGRDGIGTGARTWKRKSASSKGTGGQDPGAARKRILEEVFQVLQQISLAQHWARYCDWQEKEFPPTFTRFFTPLPQQWARHWRALALTQVHHGREPVTTELSLSATLRPHGVGIFRGPAAWELLLACCVCVRQCNACSQWVLYPGSSEAAVPSQPPSVATRWTGRVLLLTQLRRGARSRGPCCA